MRTGWKWVVGLGILAFAGCGPTEAGGPPVPVAEPPAPEASSAEEPRGEVPAVPCVPVSCEQAGSCGQLPDGCGGTLDCGDCGSGNTPEPTEPSEPEPPPPCVPLSCSALDAQCGEYRDGCGGTLHCGTCSPKETCGLFFAGRCDSTSIDQSLGSTVPRHHTGHLGHIGVESPGVYWSLGWRAPHTGAYVIHHTGSEEGVSMNLFLDALWGRTLEPARPFSHRYELEKGQYVIIWLDGWLTRYGGEVDYQLRISEWVPDERGRCGNRTDDDGDGTLDCWDPDCEQTPECLRGSACADGDLGDALPAIGSGPTEDTPHFFQPSCGVSGRNERVHVWTAPKAGRFVFHPNDYGSVISAWSGCRGVELACAVSKSLNPLTDKQAVLVREMAAGESILLVLEGWRYLDLVNEPIPSAVLVHEWQPEEGTGLCGDGRDNDADGYIDIADPDCAGGLRTGE